MNGIFDQNYICMTLNVSCTEILWPGLIVPHQITGGLTNSARSSIVEGIEILLAVLTEEYVV